MADLAGEHYQRNVQRVKMMRERLALGAHPVPPPPLPPSAAVGDDAAPAPGLSVAAITARLAQWLAKGRLHYVIGNRLIELATAHDAGVLHLFAMYAQGKLGTNEILKKLEKLVAVDATTASTLHTDDSTARSTAVAASARVLPPPLPQPGSSAMSILNTPPKLHEQRRYDEELDAETAAATAAVPRSAAAQPPPAAVLAGRDAPTPNAGYLQSVIEVMQEQGILSSQETRVLHEKIHADSADVERALEVYDDMLDQGADPDDAAGELVLALKVAAAPPAAEAAAADSKPAETETETAAADSEAQEPPTADGAHDQETAALISLVRLLDENSAFPDDAEAVLPASAGALAAIEARDATLYAAVRLYSCKELDFSSLVKVVLTIGVYYAQHGGNPPAKPVWEEEVEAEEQAAAAAAAGAPTPQQPSTNDRVPSSQRPTESPEAHAETFMQLLLSLHETGFVASSDANTLRRLWMREDAILKAAWRLLLMHYVLAQIAAVVSTPELLQCVLMDADKAAGMHIPDELCLDLQEFVDTLLRLLARENAALAGHPENVLHMIATLSEAGVLSREQASAIVAVLAASKVAPAVTGADAISVTRLRAFKTAERFAAALADSIHSYHRDKNTEALLSKVGVLATAAQALSALLPQLHALPIPNAADSQPSAAAQQSTASVASGDGATTDNTSASAVSQDASMVWYGKTTVLTRLSKLLQAGKVTTEQAAAAARALHDNNQGLLAAFETWRTHLSDDEATDLANNQKFEDEIVKVAASLCQAHNTALHQPAESRSAAKAPATPPPASTANAQPLHTPTSPLIELSQMEAVVDTLAAAHKLHGEQQTQLHAALRSVFGASRTLRPSAEMSPRLSEKERAVRGLVSKYAANGDKNELESSLVQLAVWLAPPMDAPGDDEDV